MQWNKPEAKRQRDGGYRMLLEAEEQLATSCHEAFVKLIAEKMHPAIWNAQV